VQNDLTIAGHFNTITFTNAAGASRYQVYKKINGIYGFIGQCSDGATGLRRQQHHTERRHHAADRERSDLGGERLPDAVGYFQGRRWFAGSNNKPQGVNATRSGTESNMCYSIPTQANDAISVRLTSRQNNTIRHIVPLSDLLLLTSGGSGRSPRTRADHAVHDRLPTEDYIGASNVAPVVTASAVIYAQDRGGRVREMKFQWQQQGYRSADSRSWPRISSTPTRSRR
jgi:hypothetical protein